MNSEPSSPIVVIAEGRLLLAAFYLGQGLSFQEAAERVGVSEHQLRPVMNHFGVRGRNVGKGAQRMSIVVHSDTLPLVQSASGLRGLEPNEIVEKVMRVVFTAPDLLKNILDDGRDVK